MSAAAGDHTKTGSPPGAPYINAREHDGMLLCQETGAILKAAAPQNQHYTSRQAPAAMKVPKSEPMHAAADVRHAYFSAPQPGYTK